MLEVPLVGGAVNSHQNFNVLLGENFLQFVLNFVTRSLTEPEFAPWVLDIYQEGVLLAAGAAVVPGSNIIEHYDIDIGELYLVGDQPTLDNLGKSNTLVWRPSSE